MKNNGKDSASKSKQAPRDSKRVTERKAEPKGKKGPFGRLHFGAAGSGGAENEPLPGRKRSR